MISQSNDRAAREVIHPRDLKLVGTMAEPLPALGESAEHVAYRLLEIIIANDPPKPPLNMNATWVLTTYARCLRTVKHPEPPAAKSTPYKAA